MLQFLHRHKGSVTILLCVIMIPVLAFSFGILDLCKIMMAKDAVTGTTNLALNAGLTSYDQVLKDMYGIMATSQSAEDLSEQMSKYYIASLNSSGIEGVDEGWIQSVITDLVDSAGSAVTGNEGTGAAIDNTALENNQNFMVVTPVANSDGNFVTAEPIASSAASNPSVLERQIVEHMKYRAPLNLALGMLEKLNAMKDIPNMTNAQNQKIEFEKKLSDINNYAIYSYTLFMLFYYNNIELDKDGNGGNFTIPYIEEKAALINAYQYVGDGSYPPESLATELDGIITDLKDAAARVIIYPTYGQALTGSVDELIYMYDYDDTSLKTSKIKGTKAENEIKNEVNIGEQCRIYAQNLLGNQYYGELSDIESPSPDGVIDEDGNIDAEKAWRLYIQGIMASAAFKVTSDPQDMTGNEELQNFAVDYMNFLKEYHYIRLAKQELEEEVDDLNYKLTFLEEGKDDAEIRATEKLIMEYENKIALIKTALEDQTISAVNNKLDIFTAQVKRNVESEYNKAQTAYTEAAEQLAEMYQGICKQYYILDELAKDGGYLDLFAQEVQAAQNQAPVYKSSIESIETSTQKNSSMQIYEHEVGNIEDITAEDIADLKWYLQNIKTDFENVKTAIESIYILSAGDSNRVVNKLTSASSLEEYTAPGGSKISNDQQNQRLLHVTSICSAVSVMLVSRGKALLGSAASLCTMIDADVIKEQTGSMNISVDAWSNNGTGENYCPDSIKNSNAYQSILQVAKPPKSSANDSSAADAIKEDGKASADASSGSNADVPGDAGNRSNDVKSDGGEGSSDSSSDESTMKYSDIKDIQTFSEYAADNGLDKIEMGGKGTEGFKMNIDTTQEDQQAIADQATSALTMVGDMFKILENIFESGRDSLYVTEYLTSNFSCATTNKVGDGSEVKTEKMLNGTYFVDKDGTPISIAYRSELEYILYGFDSPEKNVAAAGAIIFGIRFALNLIYSYTDSEIRATTLSAATAIGGIFPFSIPLIQTVLHIALAIAESSVDLMQLMDGAAVPLFKTSATWVCKGSNIVREVAKVVVEEVADKAINATADALCNAIQKAAEEGKDIANSTINEMDAYVADQMKQIESELHNAIMSPIQEAVQQLIIQYDEALPEDELTKMVDETIDRAFEVIADSIGVSEPEAGDNVQAMKIKAYNLVVSKADSIKASVKTNLKDFVTKSLNTTKDTLEDSAESLSDLVESKLSDVTNAINSAYTELSGAVKKGITDALDSLSEELQRGVNMGADKLKAKLSEAVQGGARGHIDTAISDMSATAKNSDFALTFTYKDYLYVFTLIGSMANNANMLERTAQMMAANCRNNGADDNYTLNTAATLLRADVQAKVSTVFYGGRFTEEKKLDLSGKRDFEFSYSSYMGY